MQRRNNNNQKQRRTYKRKPKPYKRAGPVVTHVPRRLPFGDTTRTTLVYTDQFDWAPVSSHYTHTFRGNSAYDPDYTGTGHQPRYFDTFSVIYTKYRVLGTRIDVSYTNYAGLTTAELIIAPNTEVLTLTDANVIKELPRARTHGVMPIVAGVPMTLTHSISTSKVLGLTRNAVKDDDYAALCTSNPVSIWYWIVYVHSLPSSENVVLEATVKMSFDVEFFDRKDVPLSSIVPDPESLNNEQREQLARGVDPRRRSVRK